MLKVIDTLRILVPRHTLDAGPCRSYQLADVREYPHRHLWQIHVLEYTHSTKHIFEYPYL
jgi:hypothetical protein